MENKLEHVVREMEDMDLTGNASPNLESTITDRLAENLFESAADSLKLMKIRGTILGRAVVAVVAGCYYNFISAELVGDLGLPISEIKPSGLSMGLGPFGVGDREPSRGACNGIPVQFDHVDIIDDFVPTTLVDADVILGMKWMDTLRDLSTNFKDRQVCVCVELLVMMELLVEAD